MSGAAPSLSAVAIAIRETNRHRPRRESIEVAPKVKRRSGKVVCSAVGCPWAGHSVEDFYRLHLLPMIPKRNEPS